MHDFASLFIWLQATHAASEPGVVPQHIPQRSNKSFGAALVKSPLGGAVSVRVEWASMCVCAHARARACGAALMKSPLGGATSAKLSKYVSECALSQHLNEFITLAA